MARDSLNKHCTEMGMKFTQALFSEIERRNNGKKFDNDGLTMCLFTLARMIGIITEVAIEGGANKEEVLKLIIETARKELEHNR